MTPHHIIELIRNRYGLMPREDWPRRLESALKSTVSRTNIKNAPSARGAQGEALIRECISSLTVPESYFFRHSEHFAILVDYIRHRLTTLKTGEKIYIWSAGCAEGQEPYSIAMTIYSRFNDEQRARISIYASDINQGYIEKAKEGIFAEWSFREVDEVTKNRFFTKRADGRYEIAPNIQDMVEFRCLSVQEHLDLFMPSWFDCIFFRNVGIYMSSEAQTGLYRRFRFILRTKGLLFVSPSDVAPSALSYSRYSHETTSVYMAETNEAPTGRRAHDVDVASMGRRIQEAIAAADTAVVEPMPKESNYLERGQTHLNNEQYDDAVVDFRQGVFDDEKDPIARYWYALSLQKSGMPRRAQIQLNHLMTMLAEVHPPTTVLSDGHTTAEDLLNAAIELKDIDTYIDCPPGSEAGA